MEGSTIATWTIILNNGTELEINPRLTQESGIPRITGIEVASSTLLITVNTTETSVRGFSCFSVVNLDLVRSTINVTVYGK